MISVQPVGFNYLVDHLALLCFHSHRFDYQSLSVKQSESVLTCEELQMWKSNANDHIFIISI